MTKVASFPPVCGPEPRVLILGSMPGARSLAAEQYYAHRQNAFWPIMAALFDFEPDAAYEARTRALCAHGVALWDVLKTCYREGSMDADIRDAEANDFETFLRRRPTIDRVFFNGAKAEQIWRRHVAPQLPAPLVPGSTVRLPSTSPAYAAIGFARKLEAWRVVARGLRG